MMFHVGCPFLFPIGTYLQNPFFKCDGSNLDNFVSVWVFSIMNIYFNTYKTMFFPAEHVYLKFLE